MDTLLLLDKITFGTIWVFFGIIVWKTALLHIPGRSGTYLWCMYVYLFIFVGIFMLVVIKGQHWGQQWSSLIILHHFQAQHYSLTHYSWLSYAGSPMSVKDTLVSFSPVPELLKSLYSCLLVTWVLRIYISYFSVAMTKYHNPKPPTEPFPQPYILWFLSLQFLLSQFYYCFQCVLYLCFFSNQPHFLPSSYLI